MIARLTPTRGLIFTEVEMYVEHLQRKFPNSIRSYFTHNLSIPHCFNALVEEAIQEQDNEFFFFIEEDTVPPEGVFEQMLEACQDENVIACVDYGFNGGSNTVAINTSGEIIFSGFGCTMMKRRVFEKLGSPYFRADKGFNLSNKQWYSTDPNKVYGMYDVEFGFRARENGFKFVQIPGECRHLQLIQLGEKMSNLGVHNIGEKDKITKRIVL